MKINNELTNKENDFNQKSVREDTEMHELGVKLVRLLKLKETTDPRTGEKYYPPRFDIEGGNKTHIGLARTVLRVISDPH